MEELFAINSPIFVLTRVPFSMGKNQIEYIQISNMSQNGPGKDPNNFRDTKIGYSIRIPSKSAVEELLTNLKFKTFQTRQDWKLSQIDRKRPLGARTLRPVIYPNCFKRNTN
jgi:hypothetical protein